ncbi:MAG: hypothetical protein E6J17_03345 [Chloroflexi bacterium]|nr:MAG: hypothetical protein E6J17_03345 [Chloroflexota bacterium]
MRLLAIVWQEIDAWMAHESVALGQRRTEPLTNDRPGIIWQKLPEVGQISITRLGDTRTGNDAGWLSMLAPPQAAKTRHPPA